MATKRKPPPKRSWNQALRDERAARQLAGVADDQDEAAAPARPVRKPAKRAPAKRAAKRAPAKRARRKG